jgi:hypothetical protein
VELNSRFTNRINNKFRASYTNVVDDRGVVGTAFPAVTIRDIGGSQINFGSDISSTANLLKQDILNLYDAAKFTAGKHVFTAGFDIDFNKTYNCSSTATMVLRVRQHRFLYGQHSANPVPPGLLAGER